MSCRAEVSVVVFACNENNKLAYMRWPYHKQDYALSPKDCYLAHTEGNFTLHELDLEITIKNHTHTYIATKGGKIDLTTGDCIGSDFV